MNAPGDDGARLESAYESASRTGTGAGTPSDADLPSSPDAAATAFSAADVHAAHAPAMRGNVSPSHAGPATATLEPPATPAAALPARTSVPAQTVPTTMTRVRVVSPRDLGGASKRSPAMLYAVTGVVGFVVTLAIVGPPWGGDEATPTRSAARATWSTDVTETEADAVTGGADDPMLASAAGAIGTSAVTTAERPASHASSDPRTFGVPVYSDVEVRASTQRYAYLPGNVRDPHASGAPEGQTGLSLDRIDPAGEARARAAYRERVQRRTYDEILASAGITSADARREIASASAGARLESPLSVGASPLATEGLWPDRTTIVAENPDRAQAAFAASMRLADGGELDRALVQGLVAWRHASDDPRLASHMAELCLQKGDAHAATLWARDAIEASPDFTRAWVNLGAAYLADDHPADARDAYRYAVSTDPGDWRAVAGLARAQSLLGFHAEAIAGYRNAIAMAGDETVLHFNLGLALERAGRMGEARQALLSYLRLADGRDTERESQAREWLNRNR